MHQVALRSSGLHTNNPTQDERWMSLISGSDLHVDSTNGSLSVFVYGCYCDDENERRRAENEPLNAKYVPEGNDLCIFEKKDGGRGCQIRVFVPETFCIVITQARNCLHGTLMPDEPCSYIRNKIQPVGQINFKCIPYEQRNITTLLQRCQGDEERTLVLLFHQARRRNDTFFQERIRQAYASLS